MPRSAAAKKSTKGAALLIGLRVISEGRGAFGPGKAELLRRVAEVPEVAPR